MAEDFTIEIPVTADMAPFRAGLRSGLEEAAKGVTVPVRAGGIGGGGQGSRVSPAYSASDNAAVDAAFSRIQANQGRMPGGYSPVLGGGGGNQVLMPKIDTSGIERGLREVYLRFEAIKKYVETPLMLRVDTAAVQSAMGRAATAGVSRPGETRIPTTGATTQAEWEAMTSTMPGGESPGPMENLAWRQRMNTRTGERSLTGGSGSEAWGHSRGGRFLPTNSIRGLVGILAVSELANAAQAVREGESQARLAQTPEEAALARASGVERGSSGLIGSAIAFIPNELDLPGSPQRVMREAQEAVTLRQRDDETRQRQYATAASGAAREGFDYGGTVAAEQARLRVEAQGRAETINRKIRETQARLDEKNPIRRRAIASPAGAGSVYTEGGDSVLTGNARASAQQDLLQAQRDRDNNDQQLAFDLRNADTRTAYARLESDRAISGFRRQAAGMSSREQSRAGLRDAYISRAYPDIEQFGGPEGFARNRREYHAADEAQDRAFGLQDRDLRFQTQQANFGANNQPLQAQLAAAAYNAAKLRESGVSQADVSANLAANFGAIIAPAYRAFQSGQIGLTGQANQIGAMLGRNPMGAQLAGIETQRQQGIADAQSLPFGFRQIREFGINRNAGLQGQLVERQFAERREDIGDRLDSEIRQSRDRQRGTGGGRIDARIDQLVSSTRLESRDLRRQGEEGLAQKRRQLGREQLDESRADFYRSVQFQEVADPTGIATQSGGRGPFGNVEGKFRAGQAGIDKAAKEDVGDKPKGSQLDQIIDLIRQAITGRSQSRAS